MGKAKKKAPQTPKSFTFTTSESPEVLRERIGEAVRAKGGMLYEETGQGFDLGVSRGGHSGGYWYVAILTEGDGQTTVSGEIVYRSLHGDGSYREPTRWEKIKEKLFIAIVVLLCLIPILIVYAFLGIMRLIGKLRGKPPEITMSTEEKLIHFMTEVMGCREGK